MREKQTLRNCQTYHTSWCKLVFDIRFVLFSQVQWCSWVMAVGVKIPFLESENYNLLAVFRIMRGEGLYLNQTHAHYTHESRYRVIKNKRRSRHSKNFLRDGREKKYHPILTLNKILKILWPRNFLKMFWNFLKCVSPGARNHSLPWKTLETAYIFRSHGCVPPFAPQRHRHGRSSGSWPW